MRTNPLQPDTAPDAYEEALLRRVMWRIMPILLVGLFISYVDRANLGVLFTPLSRDLNLSAATFGLAAGVFYIGYLFFEIPSNMAMGRFGARKWLARIMISWGAVTVALAFVTSATHLLALRVLLGVAEAGFFPGLLLYLTYWFPPRALTRAYGILEICIPVSLAIGVALTSGLLVLDGTWGVAGWRWVFALQGVPAILLGGVILWRLPDGPGSAPWLTAEERNYLVARAAFQGDAHSHVADLPKVIARPITWVFTLAYFAMVIGFWAITYFLPQIVEQRFKVGPTQAGFIAAIPWLVAAIAIWVVAKTSVRTGDRKWHLLVCLGAAGVGMVVSALTNSPIWALVGLSMGAAGMQSAVPLFWSMPSAIFSAGSAGIAIALINSIGNSSGLVGPWLLGVLTDLTGTTRLGLLCMGGFFFVSAVTAFFLSKTTDRALAAHRD